MPYHNGSNGSNRSNRSMRSMRRRSGGTPPPARGARGARGASRNRATNQLDQGTRFSGRPVNRSVAGRRGVAAAGGTRGKQKSITRQRKIKNVTAGQKIRGIPNNYVFVSKQENDGTVSNWQCPPGSKYLSKDCIKEKTTDKTKQQVLNTNFLGHGDQWAGTRRY